MRGYGTLRRRGGAATLHGGEGAEERKEEWSAASGEEEVGMAAALRCVGCGAAVWMALVGPGGHPEREGRSILHRMFSPLLPVAVYDTHACSCG